MVCKNVYILIWLADHCDCVMLLSIVPDCSLGRVNSPCIHSAGDCELLLLHSEDIVSVSLLFFMSCYRTQAGLKLIFPSTGITGITSESCEHVLSVEWLGQRTGACVQAEG